MYQTKLLSCYLAAIVHDFEHKWVSVEAEASRAHFA